MKQSEHTIEFHFLEITKKAARSVLEPCVATSYATSGQPIIFRAFKAEEVSLTSHTRHKEKNRSILLNTFYFGCISDLFVGLALLVFPHRILKDSPADLSAIAIIFRCVRVSVLEAVVRRHFQVTLLHGIQRSLHAFKHPPSD